MNVRSGAARTLILACVIAFVLASNAGAQFGVPFARYRTFETAHFIVTFEIGLEDYARRAAARAEAAHPLLVRAYGAAPRGKIRLVIVDQGDIFNGSATPIPTNRIVAFAHTPVENDLFFTDDPVELLMTHELAHVFHLDEARSELARYATRAPTEDTTAGERALLLYTSGTTKDPRGVVHTHAYT